MGDKLLAVAAAVLVAGCLGSGDRSNSDPQRTVPTTPSVAPAVSFAVKEDSDRLEVASAAANADWNRLAVQLDSGSAEVRMGSRDCNTLVSVGCQNQDARSDGVVLDRRREVAAEQDDIDEGDFLSFCTNSSPFDAEVRVVDAPLGTSLGTFSLRALHACPAAS